jgi:formylglycine-generating enzyme required for sulfatase activity
MKARLVVATLVVALLSCASVFGTVNIDTVLVGDIGNANDPATGSLYGGVGYAFNIGKYEVTVGQYTAFLNAVAATDTYTLCTFPNNSGIARSGTSGSYSYSVVGSPNRPIAYVSWGAAARFANWLHNGQPTGTQNVSTTEDGAYTLNGVTSNAALNAVARNANARWFIPSESEWYKSAYYQPTAQGGDPDGYWDYPMRTNSVPFSDEPPGTTPDNTRVGNFYKSDGLANGYDDGYADLGNSGSWFHQSCLTDVGAYTSSPSYYGTFDQGGNVWEWNESVISDGSIRGHRGGAWDKDGMWMRPSFRRDVSASAPAVGFRVASSIPEPSSTTLVLCGILLLNFSAGRPGKRGGDNGSPTTRFSTWHYNRSTLRRLLVS